MILEPLALLLRAYADYILASCSIGFAIALLGTVFDATSAVPRKTSILTAVLLWVMAVTFLAIPLLFSALMTAITASCWTFIAWRRAPRL